jgi:hypothetical protein
MLGLAELKIKEEELNCRVAESFLIPLNDLRYNDDLLKSIDLREYYDQPVICFQLGVWCYILR